ncbi:ornithine cyclodeaminase family protein [Candidimonas humi]|uniref:Ornithine cyclodeaminase family protein n=1 Tax=Candidimonas humi TaxID=683355 RepID=A0ABV8NVE8_9BURK|nr:ornithine cyclodeaminase family protein [Candidimonas humi]MBV6303344.1 ornithine cyclodeaminase family protein [Candidimonas humi]
MKFVSESESASIVDHALAYEAVRQAFIAAVDPGSRVFPAVIAHGSDRANRFSLKAGVTSALAGVKMGFNWPANKLRSMPSHNSIIVILDQEVGKIEAVIEAGVANAYRTSAANAVATDVLARPDAHTLAIFGAGNQAGYECAAIARIRPITQVLVVNRDESRGQAFAERLRRDGMNASVVPTQHACEVADIIVTATASQIPLFDAGWVRPGTHVSAMGADSKGKQELPVSLLLRSRLFCDLPEQSLRIGEFQHISDAASAAVQSVTAIGSILMGAAAGRNSASEITVFDSSGIALQDLFIGRCILEALRARES